MPVLRLDQFDLALEFSKEVTLLEGHNALRDRHDRVQQNDIGEKDKDLRANRSKERREDLL